MGFLQYVCSTASTFKLLSWRNRRTGSVLRVESSSRWIRKINEVVNSVMYIIIKRQRLHKQEKEVNNSVLKEAREDHGTLVVSTNTSRY